MALELKPIAEAESAAYASALEIASGRPALPSTLATLVGDLAGVTLLGAYDGTEIVGGTGFDELELTTPGSVVVPAARITLTAVLPTHRGRGVGIRLMAHQLDDIRERGIPLAMFTTSGPGVYGLIGYGPATFTTSVELDPHTDPIDRVERDDAALSVLDWPAAARVLPELFDRHRRQQPGQVLRTAKFWTTWLADRPSLRPAGTGERFAVVHRDPLGMPDGYVTYRFVAGDLREQPIAVLVVEDLIALSDDARVELWAWCASFKQARKVRAANVAPDDPLRWMLRDPRSLGICGGRDFLWLRLVDVPRALESRHYGLEGEIVIEVTDATCSANNGRFRLQASPDGAACDRTTRSPDLCLDASTLAAIYLGATTPAVLARAGRAEARDERALRAAGLLFGCQPGPWTVTDW